MLTPQLFAVLTLVLSPTLVWGALFPKDSLVKMLDAKGFKKAMRENQTSIVAFVAPWCGHCQRMVPEFSRAALGLYPLIPAYAVDCDDEGNKRLCSDQGVQGFPTVKVFPRGKSLPPIPFEGERTASGFWYFVTRRVPPMNKKLYRTEEVKPWLESTVDSGKPRAVLLYKEKKIPLLWQVLANKYDGIQFSSQRDKKGSKKHSMTARELGFEAGEKEAIVVVFAPGSMQGVKYQGINKFDSLSTFFDSVLDGTADLSVVNTELSKEEYVQTEEEKEIEMKQEAQRIALAHGGFSNLIDFEAAVKAGAGKNFHDSHGFGMMGEMPFKKKAEGESGEGASGADASKAEDTASEAEPTPSPEAEEKVEKQEETEKKAESPSITAAPSQSDAEAVTDSIEGQPMTTAPTRDEL